jgi:hypothetical protein
MSPSGTPASSAAVKKGTPITGVRSDRVLLRSAGSTDDLGLREKVVRDSGALRLGG